MPDGGKLIVACLEAQETDRVFCVPGESYLTVLNALYDSPIEAIIARQEGGAAMMAEADGKATGRPGICLVTRGPGASNAMAGVHVAQQDSTPLILIVGQVAREFQGRDAFQEMDIEATFSAVAKLTVEITNASQIPKVMTQAFNTAMNGRPGPVVISVPEDMLAEQTNAQPCPLVVPEEIVPKKETIDEFNALINSAEAPVMIVGGSGWNSNSIDKVNQYALSNGIPVAASFRRQHLFDNLGAAYAGDLGIGANPELIERIRKSDLIILLGGRLSEIPSQNFTLLEIPHPKQRLIHVHPGLEELGRIYKPTLAINASPIAFLNTISSAKQTPQLSALREAHGVYLRWSSPMPSSNHQLNMSEIIHRLGETLPDDAIITNGAGNYASWIHRFYRFRTFQSQFAPNSGSMGYGMPAAIAAKLRFPERKVICFAGDGCIQMTIQELGTAKQYGVNIIVIVIDNGMYGTIRMHQELNYPYRVASTNLTNPNFALIAEAYGFFAGTAETNEQFHTLFQSALSADKPCLIHLKTNPEEITPTMTISAIRDRHSD